LFFLNSYLKLCEEKDYYLTSYLKPKGFSRGKSNSPWQHTKYCKLHSCTPLSHRARGRAPDGHCPRAQPPWPSRCNDDPGRLSPWDASKRSLQPRMASDRARPRPSARPQSQAWNPSVHPIRGDEIRALRRLRCENPTEAHVFVSERGGPISPMGFHHLVARLGKAAKMPFAVHPHMLRHACGFKLANDGHDTRSLQHYLGHKNIQHTVRYTELSSDRFREFWR
jgi:hypothetical protein